VVFMGTSETSSEFDIENRQYKENHTEMDMNYPCILLIEPLLNC